MTQQEVGPVPPPPPLPGKPESGQQSLPGDLSQAPLSALDRVQAEDYVIAQKQRRWMRWAAFVGLGLACLGFLCGLFQVLYGLLMDHSFPLMVPNGVTVSNTHAAVLIGLALVVFAAVPLSLTITLVRLSADPLDKKVPDDSGLALTTPQLELLKSIYSLFKKS